MVSPPGDAGKNPCWQRVCQPRGRASGYTYTSGIQKQQRGKLSSKKRLIISGSQLVQIHKLISELILHLQKNRCAYPNDRRSVAGKKMFHPNYWLNSLTAKSVPAGTKNSHSEGFLLEKHLKHTAHNHHHHDAAVCPSSGMVLMEEHTPPLGASLQGVGRGCRRRVLSKLIK